MTLVVYEGLCSVCNGDLRHEEIEGKRCEVKGVPFILSFQRDEEREFEEFFERAVGKPRELQRFWMKRLVRGESFAAVAPTGIGKTAFGLAFSLFYALKGKKSYILVPTTFLVGQCVEWLNEFGKKASMRVKVNEEGEVTVAFYHGRMRKNEKERFEKLVRRGSFDILVTTTSFLSRRFNDLKGRIFDFIFVDDVDAILKSSRNVGRVLFLLGLRKEPDGWVGSPKGVLMTSTATATKGKSTRLFRTLLNFDAGSSFFTVRNVEDIAVNGVDVEKVKEVLRRMGRGCLLYVRTAEEVERWHNILKDEFKIGMITAERKRDYELFKDGRIDHLVGTSHFYGLLVRGLDLPEKIRYVVFIGAPTMKFRYETLTPKVIKILALIFKRNEKIRRYLPIIMNLERHPDKLEEMRNLIRIVSKTEEAEDIIVSEDEIIFPEVRTYIQGSGRTSRLTAHGLTKGASFLFEDDERLLKAFLKRAEYYDVSFKSLDQVDLDSLSEEIDESRRRRRGVTDIIRPALFIVESPTKARIISRLFGKPGVKVMDDLVMYEVASQNYVLLITACRGHVVDLATGRGLHGVETDGTFTPVYSTIKRCLNCNYQFTMGFDQCPLCGHTEIEDSKRIIDALRKVAYQTGFVIIGTDPDAEGEKIAWDLRNLLSGLAEVKRAEFHEVTFKAITEALMNLRDVNENLVKAQMVRRIEDRWIGFTLSQKLQQIFKNRNLSAGRVQTPVLEWIIKRYEETRRRKKIAYSPELKLTFEGLESGVDEVEVEIDVLEERIEKRSPLPPYTTDEMLRDANKILHLNSKLAMNLAQDLFEAGLITYHRTDSIHVSEVGARIAKDYLGENFKMRRWASKEGAHECIRPTRPWEKTMLQRMIYEGVIPVRRVSPRHLALYDLIFRRFMASQCGDITLKIRKYRIRYLGKEKVEERIIGAEGKALEIYSSVKVQGALPEGKVKIKVEHRVVPREYPYTQADVIGLMREKAIGRPSTYSTIIDKLFRRGYVIERKRWLFPTNLGRKIHSVLAENFKDYVSEERTRNLLRRMDDVEKGRADYQETLREIYEEIKRII